MTKEEASFILANIDRRVCDDELNEALDIAIKALEQEPCEDAMSRILKRMWNCRGKHTTSIDKVNMEQILRDELPSVNPQPCEELNFVQPHKKIGVSLSSQPKTGHWIEIAKYSDGNHKIECSECESHIFDRGHANSFNVKNKYKYCPNCGARMVKEDEQDARK